MKKIIPVLLMCALSITGISEQKNKAAAQERPVEVAKPFEIPNWSSKTIKFTVPAFGVEHQVRLAMEVCAPYAKYKAGDGSNPVLEIIVNGNSLSQKQLLNKAPSFKYMNRHELTWSKGVMWRVLYAGNFEMVKDYKDQYPGDENPYRYVFDITKFVSPGTNQIVFNYRHVLKDITLKVRTLELETSKDFIHPKLSSDVKPATTGPLPKIAPRGHQVEPVKVSLSKGGIITVAMNKKLYRFCTRTTIPGGGWKTTVVSDGSYINRGENASVNWQTPFYKVSRTVTVNDDHIAINDTITNTTDKLIGLQLENWFEPEEKSAKYFLGGNEISGNAGMSDQENPTACAQMTTETIGILPESDIFQAHSYLFRQDAKLGLRDPNLGIQAGKSVSMKWSIYPVAKGGYWDFVNAVRRNWDVNYTIPGPFAFKSWARLKRQTAAEYVKWIKARNLKMICDSIPVYNSDVIARLSKKYGDYGRFTKYAHGTAAPLGTDFLANFEYVRDTLKQALPQLEYFFYFHAQISSLEEGPALYDDSIAYDGHGTQYFYSSKAMKIYVPTENNKYGKALWDYVKLIVDKMNVNMYWDEEAYSMYRMVYSQAWDGCSVVLNQKDFTVAGKITCVSLAMQPLKLKIVDYVRQKGKILLANTQAVTPTMRKQKTLRFVEAGSYDNIYKTNLGCIIGLSTHHPEKTPEDSFDQVYNFLKRGGVYYSNWSITEVPENYFIQYMFPVTPIEISSGTIFAQERIITCNSGIFALPGKTQAKKIVAVSPQGLVVSHEKLVKELKTGSGYEYEVRIPSNYIVIIIK